MTFKMACCAAGAALAALVAAPVVSFAGAAAQCASADEASAFDLRDLQSQLMVAGLACNQEVAYNDFVGNFRPLLAAAGQTVSAYFYRTGGGETALNQHITALANANGLARAENPEDYCQQTWTMFLLLQKEPLNLPAVAAEHVTHNVAKPGRCEAPRETDTAHGLSDVFKAAVENH